MTKKVIVIASVIFLISAIYGIGIQVLKIQGKLPQEAKDYDPYDLGLIIVLLLVVLATSAAIFDAIPAKSSRIWLIAVSVLSPMIIVLLFRLLLSGSIESYHLFKSAHGNFLFLALCLGSVAVIITSIVNIRRALSPSDKTQNTEERKVI